MKIEMLGKWSLGLLLAALPWISGCGEDSAQSAPATAPVVQTAVVPNADTLTGEDAVAVAPDQKPAVADIGENPLPANINPSGPTASVIRMVQAGVDESVMLAFVSNSLSTFNLSSDDIIYLRDLGVPDSVVTGMIQRDQAIKQMSETELAATASAATATAEPVSDESAAPPAAVQVDEAASAAAPPPNVTYNYFYDSLSPYGSWINIAGYGWCWQPTIVVVNTGWRPYCDNGRWVYTSSGWYWYSNYSWGWAPFHYGRWFRHARWGWCWVPGRTWGPAWVSWRYSSDYCGWAPLPPGAHYRSGVGFTFHNRSVGVSFGFGLDAGSYVFVPVNRFCDERPYHYRVPSHQVGAVFRHTTVNNVVSERNRTIFNRGIEPRTITAVTRTPIHEVQIQNVTAPRSPSRRADWLEPGGRTLAVYHPALQERAPAANHMFARTRSPGTAESGRSFENRTGHQPRQSVAESRSLTPTVTQTRLPQSPVMDNAPARPPTRVVTQGTIVLPETEARSAAPPRSTIQPVRPTMNQAPVRSQPPMVNNQPVRPATPYGGPAVQPQTDNRIQPVVPGRSVQPTVPNMNQAPVRQPAPTINRQPVPPATPAPGSVSRPAWNQPRAFNYAPTPQTRTFTAPNPGSAPRMNETFRASPPQSPMVRQPAPAYSPRVRSEIIQPRTAPAPQMNNAPAARTVQPPAAPTRNFSPRTAQQFQPNNWSRGGNVGNRR